MEESKFKGSSTVTWIIIAVNIAVFIIVEATGSSEDAYHMIKWGAAYTPLIEGGEFYRLFTSMFLHFGFRHLAINMFVLLISGGRVESALGRVKYLILYLGGGLFGNILSFCAEVWRSESVVSAGASGAIFAVLGCMLVAAYLNRGIWQGAGLHRVSIRRFIIVAAVLIFNGFATSGVDGYAHLGGFAVGAVFALIFTHSGRKAFDGRRGFDERRAFDKRKGFEDGGNTEMNYAGRPVRGTDGKLYCPYCRCEVNLRMRVCTQCGRQLRR